MSTDCNAFPTGELCPYFLPVDGDYTQYLFGCAGMELTPKLLPVGTTTDQIRALAGEYVNANDRNFIYLQPDPRTVRVEVCVWRLIVEPEYSSLPRLQIRRYGDSDSPGVGWLFYGVFSFRVFEIVHFENLNMIPYSRERMLIESVPESFRHWVSGALTSMRVYCNESADDNRLSDVRDHVMDFHRSVALCIADRIRTRGATQESDRIESTYHHAERRVITFQEE